MDDGERPGIIRSPAKLHHEVGLAPHELETRQERVEDLTRHFLEIAARDESDTDRYMAHGGNLRLCLTEIMALTEPCDEELQIRELRAEYMGSVLQRKGIRHRRERKRQVRDTEERYIEAVVGKIEAMVDAYTPEDALALGQMPSLIRHSSFNDEPLSQDDLAANHLYLLVDTALKEHVHRRHAVERHAQKGRVAKAVGNRTVHMSVAASVFAASLAPKVGIWPELGAQAVQDTETAVRVISGLILTLTTPEALRMKLLQVKHDKRTDDLHGQLAEDRVLADRALRITYNATRYGSADGNGIVTGRSGTDDKEENLRRFALMDTDFPHLNNDPGGKPYTGEQALGYAARLLIERGEELEALTDPAKPAAERRGLYMELVRGIITEDVIRMKKGLNFSRTRRRIMNALAVVPAVLFPREASSLHEAEALSKGAAGTLSGESESR